MILIFFDETFRKVSSWVYGFLEVKKIQTTDLVKNSHFVKEIWPLPKWLIFNIRVDHGLLRYYRRLTVITVDWYNSKIEKSRISQNWQRQGPIFRKLQETIWLGVFSKIFEFSQHLELVSQESYLYKLSSGYPSYSGQKWYIWTSFQTFRKGFVNFKKPCG